MLAVKKIRLFFGRHKNNFRLYVISSFKKDDITSTIKSLNPTKVHGFDHISVCMI